MNCIFVETGDMEGREKRCSRLGCYNRAITEYPPEKIFAKCRSPFAVGWGDRLAWWLEAFGISKARTMRALQWLGLLKPNKPCGCGSRQEKLNRLGDRLWGWVRRLF